jgi:hypothetical protein
VVEPPFLERADARLVESDARGNQIRVVTKTASLRDQDFQIVTQQGFAARKSELNRAQRAPFAQHAYPVVGGELRAMGHVIDRVVAEHAVQRAAISQLRQ